MFNWLFGKKENNKQLEEDVKKSFQAAKTDMNNMSIWIKHLNEKQSKQEFLLTELNSRLASLEIDIEGLKDAFAMSDSRVVKQAFKTPKAVLSKHVDVLDVQEGVQTSVQTGVLYNISNFSITERALIFVLLNSELKLSYEDLAAMLGKNRATIRGQVNAIKQKSEGLIEEIMEKNGKKRVYIPEEVKEKLLRSVKTKNSEKKGKK